MSGKVDRALRTGFRKNDGKITSHTENVFMVALRLSPINDMTFEEWKNAVKDLEKRGHVQVIRVNGRPAEMSPLSSRLR